MPHPFSGLTILTLALALFVGSLTGSASAQATGIADLPDCAADCVRTSATAANCALTDVPCLCSTGFSPAVQQCAIPVCGFGDRSTISGVLREMCESQTSPTSQPQPSASSSPSPTPTPNSAPAPSPSSTTTTTRTTTPPSPPTTGTGTTSSSPGGLSPSTTLGVGTGRSSSSTSASPSSTTVVVATVVLPQTTALGGAGSIKLGGGRGVLGWVGVGVGVLVGVGGLVL